MKYYYYTFSTEKKVGSALAMIPDNEDFDIVLAERTISKNTWCDFVVITNWKEITEKQYYAIKESRK